LHPDLKVLKFTPSRVNGKSGESPALSSQPWAGS